MPPKVKRLQNNENSKVGNIEDGKVKQVIITSFFGKKNTKVKTDQSLVQPLIVTKGLSESKVVQNELANIPASIFDDSGDDAMPAACLAPEPSNVFRVESYINNPEWKQLLQTEFQKKYFTEINTFLDREYKKGIVRPPKDLVFNALNSTPIENIKVVIIGQDPYHNDNQAHGLSFSVPDGIPLPPSLKNIFIELKNDIPEFQRSAKNSGCLQKWTTEGVFMLNAILTVEAHKASSHSKIGWETFTDEVIRLISKHNDGCAFLLWGNYGKKKETLIDTKKHAVIKSGHPSPFSVNLFFNSKCFSKANEFLTKKNKKPINWSLN